MDDENRSRPQHRPEYNNGNSAEMQRRKNGTDWDQMLLETGIDQWDVRDRRQMQSNLSWVSDRRRSESTRRRLITLALGIGIPLFGAAGAWYGASNAKPSPCPSGYICTVTPLRTPSP